MLNLTRRDIILTSKEITNINNAKLAIFGLGGVGGYALEAFIRMGFNDFIICDGDVFDESNINRQLYCTNDSIGLKKTEVSKNRILSINKDANVLTYDFFINDETINNINLDDYYVVDMIDDVNAKLLLIKYAKEHNLDYISMMGAGNRIDASFKRADISKTTVDPLSRIMRKKLKELGIKNVDVIYSETLPIENNTGVIGSLPNVCMKAGSYIASEVIKDILSR